MNGTVKEERWILITKNKTENILQGKDTVKFIKSLRLRWYGYGERMQNKENQHKIATATMEGGSNSGRPCKRRGKEVEVHLNMHFVM
jgi:hypothetical protein